MVFLLIKFINFDMEEYCDLDFMIVVFMIFFE